MARGIARPILLISLMLVSYAPLSELKTEPEAMEVGGASPVASFDPDLSFRFIQSSQNIKLNSMKDLSDMNHYVSIHVNTVGVEGIDTLTRGLIIARVQSYQNADGGFGDWENDRSKSGSTRIALETLHMLGASPLNETAILSFMDRLQVNGLAYGNHGFRSSIKESDADISTTYDAVKVYGMLGTVPPNQSGVVEYIHQHRNDDGGYGYQTNREAGIFWTSTTIHTQRALLSLEILNQTPQARSLTLSFLSSVQNANGGFTNTPSDSARVAYTLNAVQAYLALGEATPRSDDVSTFIRSNQVEEGGFVEYSLDAVAGKHTTNHALKALTLLGESAPATPTLDGLHFEVNSTLDGGFGNQPGLDSNVRVTFDAISALNSIGRRPNNVTAAGKFLLSMQNADGGFGQGISSVESTYRSVLGLHRLGFDVPNSTSTIEFIRSSQNNDGGFGFSPGRQSTGAYTYRSIMALDLLGSQPVDLEGAVEYLQGLQNSDGGFSNLFVADSGIGSTYRSIRGLAVLGAQPLDVDGAEAFITDSQNPDGGFRQSPSSLNWPTNISSAVRTYDGILALELLDRPLANITGADGFLKALRNPDLGFAPKPDYTSEVDDTFSALLATLVLHPTLDTSTTIENWSVSHLESHVGDTIWFNLTYNDSEGNLPDSIQLLVGGEVHLMPLSRSLPATSTLDLQLHNGMHDAKVRIIDSNGEVTSQSIDFRVDSIGEPPSVETAIDTDEGDLETIFTFSARYSDPDGDSAQSVRISIDGSAWLDMTDSGESGLYIHSTQLGAGRHTFRVRVSDGINIVISDNVQSPLVHSPNVDAPDWDVFLKIQSLLKAEKGAEIEIDDVSRTLFEGQQSWVVVLADEVVHISIDGDRILIVSEDGGGSGQSPLDDLETKDWLLILGGVIILILVLVVLFGGGKEGEKEYGGFVDEADSIWGDLN